MGLLEKGERFIRKRGRVTAVQKEPPTQSVEEVRTDVDLIYGAVLEKQRLTLKNIAETFKISLNKVEEWAKILDKMGLLELHYPVAGEAELRVKNSEFKISKPFDKRRRLFIFTAFLLVVVTLGAFLMIKIFRLK